jgi:hypothetical protein
MYASSFPNGEFPPNAEYLLDFRLVVMSHSEIPFKLFDIRRDFVVYQRIQNIFYMHTTEQSEATIGRRTKIV